MNLEKKFPAKRQRHNRRHSYAEVLEPRIVLAPIISEFQAINRSTILDEDGASSDWIEIQNPGSEAIDLQGWYLTDDAVDLTKWKFPIATIEPGDELLVFASGKNRVNSAELHTNFRLSGDGEYLALIRPDGETIEQDFGAAYPAQHEDFSYGLAQDREATELVNAHSSVLSMVPMDDTLSLDWTQIPFDDTNWSVGTGAVGFENLRPEMTTVETFDAPLPAEWTVDVPNGANSTVAITDGGLRFSVPAGEDTAAVDRGLAPIVYRELPVENATDWEFIAHIKKEKAGDRGSVGIMIFDQATGKPALMLEQSVRRRFALISGGSEVEWTQSQSGSFFLRLARNELEKTWSASAKLEPADAWTPIATVTDGTFEGPVVAEPRLGLFARTPVGTIDALFESVEIVVAQQRPTYGPFIGLDLANEMAGVNASAFVRYPFQIDGEPGDFDVLRLGTQYDDGFDAYLNGTLISKNNTPVVSAWNSTATSVHGAVLNRIPLAEDDVSESLGALKTGDNVLAIHGMNVSADDSDFYFQGGLVASRVRTLEEREFNSPTPGAPNLAPAAPAPQLVGKDGVFFGTTTVEFMLEDGAPASLEIRYTLDGTQPTADSQRYAEPFTLTSTSLLQARTFDTLLAPNFQPSNITSKTFLAVSEGLSDRTSNLPLLVIDTLGQELPGTNSNDLQKAGVVLLDVSRATSTAALENGTVDYLGRGGVRRRGASTGAQIKPQMAFETWGPAGTNRDDDFDSSLLGLAPESDWVLHAPFGGDPVFMRNALGFELSNQMGRWAPRTRFVEVYLNDGGGIVSESHYVGVYVLIEKIKPGPGRLDIAQIDQDDNHEPEISGGYIWKVDRPDPDAPAFAAGGNSLNWVYPESPDSINANPQRKATSEQQQWVQGHFNAFGRTLANPDINDPDGYSKYIDVDAWIDYHLMQVVMYNADALGLSIFFHKGRNERISAGPLWDLNLTAESTRIDDDNPNLWLTGANFFGGAWWRDLVRDPGFWQRYADRLHMWRSTLLADENISNVISRFRDQIAESADRDAVRWPDNSFREVSGFNSGYLDGTFHGEVEHIRHWMFARMKFLDRIFSGEPEIRVDGIPLADVRGVQVPTGQEIEIVSAPIERPIDEKLVSGVPGETMASYFVPSDDALGDTWTTVAFDDANWQRGPLGIGFERRDNFVDLIKTTVDPRQVTDGATNILARILFDIPDLNAIDDRSLVLRMKFEDGYIAHLNGERVARDKVQSVAATWDARANNQSTDDALQFQEIDISRSKHVLVEGTNMLAIRVLNSSASSGEMLLLPELVLRTTGIERNPDARVYYTIDGTDPRGPDGNPSANAIESKPDDKLRIDQNTRVIARNLDATDRGPEAEIVKTDWGAPIQYDFLTSSNPLVISEINYHPAEPSETEAALIPDDDNDGTPDWTSQDFEFIEIHNPGDGKVNSVGVAFSNGVEFDFFTAGVSEIVAGGYGVVVSNQNAFQLRYGDEVPILGQYTGNLDNNGERVELVDGTGTMLFSVNYGDNDPWPVRTDGLGSTLVLSNESPSAHNKFYAWRASTELHGSPGVVAEPPVGVWINEVLASTQAPVVDAIELFNATDSSIDIGGWYLSDSANDLQKFQIPIATNLAAGQYVVFDESHFNTNPDDPSSFGLSGDRGDDVWLTIVDAGGMVSKFVDDVHFRATRVGESIGRIPNGMGRPTPLKENSFGTVNESHRPGSVVITEVNYNPGAPSEQALQIDPALSSGDLEFIELFNRTDQSIDLDQWRLRGGVDFDFDGPTILAANQTLILIRFQPESGGNVHRLAAFKTHYEIPDDVVIVGGLNGQLSNNQDKLLLLQAKPALDGRPHFRPQVQEDEVIYDDAAPWPLDADGFGPSLQRLQFDSLGNDGTSWIAGPPSPGKVSTEVRGDFDGDGVVGATDIDLLAEQIRSPNPDPQFDLTNDGSVDTSDRDVLVREILGTHYGDSNLDGMFDSSDLVNVFVVGEYEDGIPGNSTWAEGDWNSDGEFGSGDLVLAFIDGGFVFAATGGSRTDLAFSAVDIASSVLTEFDEDVAAKEKAVASMTRATSPPNDQQAILTDGAIESLFA